MLPNTAHLLNLAQVAGFLFGIIDLLMNPLKQFLAKLSDQQQKVLSACESCFQHIIGGNNPKATEEALHRVVDRSQKLIELLTKETTPACLVQITHYSQSLTKELMRNDSNQRVAIFGKLNAAYDQLRKHRFNSDSLLGVQPLVSLDKVIEKHHNQTSIDEHYDKAIHIIEEALANGDVDSSTIQRDLKRILATINEAKRSTFLNQLFQIPNLMVYLRATGKVAGKRVPIIRELMEVIEEANKELGATKDAVAKDTLVVIERKVSEVTPYIEQQPERNLIENGEVIDDENGKREVLGTQYLITMVLGLQAWGQV